MLCNATVAFGIPAVDSVHPDFGCPPAAGRGPQQACELEMPALSPKPVFRGAGGPAPRTKAKRYKVHKQEIPHLRLPSSKLVFGGAGGRRGPAIRIPAQVSPILRARICRGHWDPGARGAKSSAPG